MLCGGGVGKSLLLPVCIHGPFPCAGLPLAFATLAFVNEQATRMTHGSSCTHSGLVAVWGDLRTPVAHLQARHTRACSQLPLQAHTLANPKRSTDAVYGANVQA